MFCNLDFWNYSKLLLLLPTNFPNKLIILQILFISNIMSLITICNFVKFSQRKLMPICVIREMPDVRRVAPRKIILTSTGTQHRIQCEVLTTLPILSS